MITKIEWQARVSVPEKEVGKLLDWAQEVERGLKLSELVPEDATVAKCDRFMGTATCTVTWETENEMAYEPNYAA